METCGEVGIETISDRGSNRLELVVTELNVKNPCVPSKPDYFGDVPSREYGRNLILGSIEGK